MNTEIKELTREYLTLLKRISKLFETPLPLGRFGIVDTYNVTMIEVVTPMFEEECYWFSNIPNNFLDAENDVVCDSDGLTINNSLFLPKVGLGDESRIKAKYPNIRWNERICVYAKISAKKLRSLLDREHRLRFIKDTRNTRIDVYEYKEFIDYSYILNTETVAETEDSISSVIDAVDLNKYKALFSGTVTIRFSNDAPVEFCWRDDAENQYTVLVAPRMCE